jgi:hypothetical protein
MPRLAHPKKNPLLERMQRDYDSLDDFYETSKIPLAKESCRRLIYEGREVSAPVYIIIMKYLGYTPAEIKSALIKLGEKEFSSLIGESNVSITPWEEAMISLTRKIRGDGKEAWEQLISSLQLIAKAYGINVSGDMARLKRIK